MQSHRPTPLSPDQAWRLRQDSRPLSLRTSLSGALNKLHILRLQRIAETLGIPLQRKAALVTEISRALSDSFSLVHFGERLPPVVRRVLRTVLDHHGWVEYRALVATFGDEDADAPTWDPAPTSSIGIARAHGLLFVGTTMVSGTHVRMAVIPRELREPLDKILAQEKRITLDSAVRGADLTQVFVDLEAHYARNPTAFLPPEPVEAFLRDLAGQKPRLVPQAWDDIRLFEEYLGDIRIESQRLDALAGYHISEFVLRFIDMQGLAWPQRRRRALLETLRGLLPYLSSRSLIISATFQRLDDALAAMLRDRRRVRSIERPAPLGGEPILQLNEGRQPITFTFNDLWLLQAALGACHGDLRALAEMTIGIPDGAVKRKRIEWLLQRDLVALSRTLSTQPLDGIAEALDWFANKTFNRGNAWQLMPDE